MTNDKIIGVTLGSVLCAVVIAGNAVRSDPRHVSVFPDFVSVAVAPLAVYVVGRRRRRRGESSESVRAFGIRVGAIGGAVFATGLAAFAWYWSRAGAHLAFVSGIAFTSVFAFSWFSASAAARGRIAAV